MGHIGLLTLAGLLGLIALAFGEQAAVRTAQAILIMGALAALALAYLIVGERI